jgi:hypothetical protein
MLSRTHNAKKILKHEKKFDFLNFRGVENSLEAECAQFREKISWCLCKNSRYPERLMNSGIARVGFNRSEPGIFFKNEGGCLAGYCLEIIFKRSSARLMNKGIERAVKSMSDDLEN